ncbi:MAG: CAP domain-containing protein [Flavobacteriales bacterium]|nr:CAP domain-containing protein [Flavobacteriales bacterium]
MKSKLCVIVISLFLGITVSAQEREEALSQLLIDQLNEFRSTNQLSLLEGDEILEAVAFDQAKYIVDLGKVVHEQNNTKKKTVQDRVNYYEGLNANLGENAAKISMGAKEQIELNGARVTINTDDLLLKAVIASWLKDEGNSKLNLLDPNFYKVGIGVIVSNEVDISVVAVFGSEPYKIPIGTKVSLKNHGIKPYDEASCKEFLADYPTLPQLLSDVVKMNGNEVTLRYHSLGLFQNIISNSSDGIALDIIEKEQYLCDGGNRLFPGSIADGYLLKPIRKGYINTHNKLDSIDELDLNMGSLASFYKSKKFEINLVLFKSGTHCVTIPFNNLEVKNKNNFDLPFLLAGESTSKTFVWKDSIAFQYSLLSDWSDQKEKDLKALQNFEFQIESETSELQVSPIHENEINLDSSFQGQKIKVAWDSLNQYIKGSYYQLDLAELDQNGKIEFLKEAVKEDQKLNKFLEGLNTLSIKLSGEGKIDAGLKTIQALELYELFLKNNKIKPALFLQAKLLEKVRNGELKASELPQADPSQKENTLSVINNQIVLEHILGAGEYGGNPLYLAFFELYLINKNEVEISFNYHVAKLAYWSKSRSKISNFPSWIQAFKKISSASIPAEKYARAMLNYNLLAVDYYYDVKQFDQRKKAFAEVIKWQGKAMLNEREILELSKTLRFQDQFSEAIKILLPFTIKETVKQEILFFLLQISQYDKTLIDEKMFEKKILLASKLFPHQFCSLFSKKQMGYQSLKNSKIKELYCKNCN